MILAGDIGGTKSIFGIFSEKSGLRSPLAQATYPTREYPSLEAMVAGFLSMFKYQIRSACFGIAGPVVDGKTVTTNLPWRVDEKLLTQDLAIPSVRLLNDLEALALAVPYLKGDDLHVLSPGRPQRGGAMAVIAPGTGLGEAYLTWNGSGYLTHPSEGGHCDFAPRNPLEMDLLRYLQGRFDHVSYELVCSGRGIPNLFAYLRDAGIAEEPPWLHERIEDADDPVPILLEGAMTREPACELCTRTLDLFLSILGAEAGNLALKVMATGGLYLGGGIPGRILPHLINGPFLPSFKNKGRLSHVLDIIPVHVILNPQAALMGAAIRGMGQGRREEGKG